MGLLFESIYMDILSVIVALSCITYTYFKYAFTYWSRRGVYTPRPLFPFGNSKKMILQQQTIGEELTDIYRDLKKKGLKFGGYYIFSSPQFMVLDPELLKTIMARDFSYFADRAFKSNEEKEPITGHLLGLTGHKWKSMRQKLTPTFSSGKIKMMFETILSCADGLEGILDEFVRNKEDIDIKDVLGRYTTDIIGSCAFGLDCNSIQNKNSEFANFARKAFAVSTPRAIKRTIARLSLDVLYFFNLKLVDEDITDFFMKVVADTIEYREKNNITRNDFLQLLINIKNTGSVDKNSQGDHTSAYENGLTLNEITAQSFIFFLAGFETSSTAMSFFLLDMAGHQDIQDKVRKEISEMFQRHNGKLTYDGIMELQYLEMALFESMRLYSAIPFLDRRCTQDYKIPNTDVIIPKDTIVTIPILGLQTDPEYYPEPEKYDPERFSKEETAKRHPFTFLPFGEGPRVCIGQRFGLLQTKVGLVSLLRNHRFSLSPRTQIPIKMKPKPFIFQVEGGIWLKAERV